MRTKEKLLIRQRIASKKYYQKNKEKEKKRRREYYYDNFERESIVKAIWYQKNKEKIKKQKKEYYWSNRKKELERIKKYRHSKEGKKTRKKYKQNNRDLIYYHNLRRRKKVRLTFSITKQEINQIYERDGCCIYCGSDENLTLDHIISVDVGGHTVFNNMVVACQSCNSSKRNKDVFEWCDLNNVPVPNIIKELI